MGMIVRGPSKGGKNAGRPSQHAGCQVIVLFRRATGDLSQPRTFSAMEVRDRYLVNQVPLLKIEVSNNEGTITSGAKR